MPAPIPPPNEHLMEGLQEHERSEIEQTLAAAVVGGPEAVRRGIDEFIARTGADELIIVAQIFDHRARLKSYEIVSEI